MRDTQKPLCLTDTQWVIAFLAVVMRLRGRGDVETISSHLAAAVGGSLSSGFLSGTLGLLEKEGLITSYPKPGQTGKVFRPVLCFETTRAGDAVIKDHIHLIERRPSTLMRTA
jgi:hypothetical protein